jgi:hypothetical protein
VIIYTIGALLALGLILTTTWVIRLHRRTTITNLATAVGMRALQRSLPDPGKDASHSRYSVTSDNNPTNIVETINTSATSPNTLNQIPSSVVYDEIKEDVQYDEIIENTMNITIPSNPTTRHVDDGYLEPITHCAGPSGIQVVKSNNADKNFVIPTTSCDDGYLEPAPQHAGPSQLHTAMTSVKVPMNPGDPGSQYDDVLNLKDKQEIGEYHYILHKGVKV